MMNNLLNIFQSFLRLGCISFGGPIAHVSYYQTEFVEKKKWLDNEKYANYTALCQFLPGPTSSQAGMCIGYERGGYVGMVLAWIGFTLPSAVIMYVAAVWLNSEIGWVQSGWLHGLKIVAVAVVAQAVLKMFTTLCPDWNRRILMGVTACVLLFFPSIIMQISLMALCGIFTIFFYNDEISKNVDQTTLIKTRNDGVLLLFLFLIILFGLPIVAYLFPLPIFEYSVAFYQSGSLVFGGGHVVLPFMQAYMVPPGWITTDSFLTGYSLAQAVPGPMFSFALYLGALLPGGISPLWNGIMSLFMIYLPSFLLLGGMMPYWQHVSGISRVQAFMKGVNASVVGLLFASWINPVILQSVTSVVDIGFAILLFVLMYSFRMPAWGAVLLGIVFGFFFG